MNEMTPPGAPSAPAISKANFKPLKECATLEEAFHTAEFRERIAGSVPDHVRPERMLRTFMTAASRTPMLYQASVRSFVGACLTLSQVGLEPNTPLGNAYLIPFKNRRWNPRTREQEETVDINVIFGYPGLLDLSYRTRLVKSVHADVVWPGHEFSFEYGTNAHLMHKPIGAPRDPGAKPVYAYMHASLQDGQAFEVMPYADVLAIRDKSQAYRYALAARVEAEEKKRRMPAAWTEAPWVAHEIAMARKTAFRAGSKWLPRSVELASVLALDEAQERRRGGMDFTSAMEAPTIDGKVDYLAAAVDAANRPEDEEQPIDPGAAFGVRAQQPETEQPAAPPEKPAPPPPEKPAAPPPAPSAPPAPPPAAVESESSTNFETVLIEANGDASDRIFTDAVQFAAAYIELWNATPPDAREALSQHNMDALIDAAAVSARAQQMLEGLGEAAEQGHFEAIQPPVERGKIYWPGYVKLLRDAATRVESGILAWAEAQRETMLRCPMAQRVLAVRALLEVIDRADVGHPPWLADLLKPKERAAAALPLSEPPERPEPPPPVSAPDDGPLDEDEAWVEARIQEVRDITTREDFNRVVTDQLFRTTMARLRRDRPALFQRANTTFGYKNQELPGEVQ